MKQKLKIAIAVLIGFIPQISLCQEAADVYYGGSIGLTFGDVDYVEISPMVGMHFTPQLSAGVSAMYRWRSDSRYEPELKTEDYGATVFVRLHVSSSAYLQAEYEYLDYEVYIYPGLTTERRQHSSLLAGGGVSQPIGQNTYAYATALYNVDYDEVNSPYADPWVYRVGISVGF
ncbi:MAG: hypothetical protein JXA04_09750 [Gammaproteobacteria bacterium]|nr:hypothetical protein [Gammaproteobacteria bacterium]